MLRAAMSENIDAPGKRSAVIALHCSGSAGRQWSKLPFALGKSFTLIAPDLIGYGATPPWNGGYCFRLEDEAAHIIEILDAQDGPVHLVGHSYGGGVALRVARERPAQVASMALYEPTAFHVLGSLGPDGQIAFEEIHYIADCIAKLVADGDYRAAAARFIDYWNGAGTWAGMKPESQDEFLRYIPKAPLEFRALLDEPTPLTTYRQLTCPVLLMRGALAPMPTALITSALFSIMPNATIKTVADAGHMGPFSHADVVGDMVAAHIASVAGWELASCAKSLVQPIDRRAVI